MDRTVRVALIGAGATIVAAIIGVYTGKTYEQSIVQKQIENVLGDNINVTGEGNNVVINNVTALAQDYVKSQEDYDELQGENESLVEQNNVLSNKLNVLEKKFEENGREADNEIENLKTQINNFPVYTFKDLALCIGVHDVNINTDKSFVNIDGRDYFSREIIEKVIPNDNSLVVKNGTIYIGQVISEKANLFDQYIKSSLRCAFEDSVQDSYGYTHTNCLCFVDEGFYGYGNSAIEFSLQNKYSIFDCKLFVYGNYTSDKYATITVKADEEVIKIIEVTDDTETIAIEGLIINKCSKLSISKSGSEYFGCAIYDAIIYN